MLKTIRENLINQIEDDTIKDVLPTAVDFSVEVEAHSAEHGVELLEALSYLTDYYKLDEAFIKKLLTPALIEKLGIEQGIIKKQNKLPFA